VPLPLPLFLNLQSEICNLQWNGEQTRQTFPAAASCGALVLRPFASLLSPVHGANSCRVRVFAVSLNLSCLCVLCGEFFFAFSLCVLCALCGERNVRSEEATAPAVAGAALHRRRRPVGAKRLWIGNGLYAFANVMVRRLSRRGRPDKQKTPTFSIRSAPGTTASFSRRQRLAVAGTATNSNRGRAGRG
jgi:hypothetical protein